MTRTDPVDDVDSGLYNSCMAFTLTLRPEIEERLRARAAEEHRSVHKTVELAVEEYLQRGDHRTEVLEHFRAATARHRDFYDQLGDR